MTKVNINIRVEGDINYENSLNLLLGKTELTKLEVFAHEMFSDMIICYKTYVHNNKYLQNQANFMGSS